MSSDALQQVLSQLPKEDAAALKKQLMHVAWYPMALGLRLDAAIASVIRPDQPDKVFIEMGSASANTHLSGDHASFVTPGDPHGLLSAAPHIYRLYYDKGRRTYERLGAHSGVLRTYEAENVTASDCLTIVGWHQRAIEICGVHDVHVHESACRVRGAAFCEYQCQWA